ncbi:MAG TPA: DEAD/DEAH box helicase [Patescibacteria group bacterium]|nr:DEAD/DEAH box helicase [Patescibacteria group bacterium]
MYRKFNNHNRQSGRRFPRRQKSASTAELMQAINSVKIIDKGEIPSLEEIAESSFSDFKLVPQLLNNISQKGYTIPTPIQNKSIPPILEGNDVIGIANTGTGKTGAFLIPLINKVFLNKSEKVFILAPTRELAVQIQEELSDFSKGMGIRSVLCIGGESIWRQKKELRNNPNFVIGTPGRVRDLIKERNLSLGTFRNVVLDETDRMVDIGFIADIKYFISLLPYPRQSLFFSATVPAKVQEVLRTFIKNGVTISVKERPIAEGIHQEVIRVGNYNKVDKLHDLLSQDGFDKVLVFGRTKWGVQKLAEQLMKRGFKVGAIHGNKNQNQRQRVLEQFKASQITILLATDVASRGLDIPDVSHVINYDMPATMDDYAHRIGRTGRANKKGIALTFI